MTDNEQQIRLVWWMSFFITAVFGLLSLKSGLAINWVGLGLVFILSILGRTIIYFLSRLYKKKNSGIEQWWGKKFSNIGHGISVIIVGIIICALFFKLLGNDIVALYVFGLILGYVAAAAFWEYCGFQEKLENPPPTNNLLKIGDKCAKRIVKFFDC